MSDCHDDIFRDAFPKSFFEDEVREGFFVTSMMKRYWASQLRILMEVEDICARHDIKWFADFGTLLGAVRHGGYVPWDDDLDISMFRDDWIHFFEVASKELPSDYVIMTVDNQEEYRQTFGRIVNGHVIDCSEERLEKFFGCPYTVGVDIFPLDGVYDDSDIEKDRKIRASKAIDRYLSEEKRNGNIPKVNDLLKDVVKIYSECPVDQSSKVALMPFFVSKNNHIYSKDIFSHVVKIPFEGIEINVPGRYGDKLLLDYCSFMKVNRSSGKHEYPVYEEQEQLLRESLKRNPYRYTLDYNSLANAVKRYAYKALNPKAKKDRKKIVFLPCKAKWWVSMEKYWRKAVSDPMIETHVIPIFYYDTDYNGQIGEMHDERNLFPDYVNAEDCTKYDFEKEHPDVIVMQVPYDDWSTYMTVHEYFYSSSLLNYTEELIYIPCFEADDPIQIGDRAWKALSVLAEQPAVVNADKIILPSLMMKRVYMSRMLELCGKETEKYWDNKLVLDDYITWGKDCKLPEEIKKQMDVINSDTVDLEWNNLVRGNNDKKVIIYYINIDFLLRGGIKAVEKIRQSFNSFADAADEVSVIVLQQEVVKDNLEEIDSELAKSYYEVLSQVGVRWNNCVLDEAGVSLKYMNKWGGFFGNAGIVARKCIEAGIPVMFQNLKI